MSDIQDFLGQKRIALVGVSRDEKDFSRMVFRAMRERGYEMVPVNPAAEEVEGQRCFPRVLGIEPRPEAALIMTRAAETEGVVRDCAAAGVRRVWMHRSGGEGAVSKEAVEFCRSNGMRLVEGHCPFMFLSGTPFFHRIHGWVMKVFGGYPKAA